MDDYTSCVVSPDPGFACPLATSIMPADYVYSQADGSRSYAPKNYVGVLQWLPDIQVIATDEHLVTLKLGRAGLPLPPPAAWKPAHHARQNYRVS